MKAGPPPAPGPAELERHIARLARGSRLTTMLSIAGLLAVLGALVLSGRELAELNEERASLDQQIEARQAELRMLTDSLVRSREGYSAYAAVVRREQPALAEEAASVARDSAAAARVVYIQYRGSVPRSLAEQVRARLAELGFHAPGVERIDRDFDNSVRYFHADDASAAEELARRAGALLAERGCPADFPVQDMTRGGFAVPRGQVELWIDLTCPGAAGAY